MSGFVQGEDRTQATLFPGRLADCVAEDSPVRVIDVFIDELDLAQDQRRFGYRRIYALLRRDRPEINHKRRCRHYREVNLAMHKRKRCQGVAVQREPLTLPEERVADSSISGHYVCRVLDRAARFRGHPQAIRTDQEPEFTGMALDQWA